MDFHLERLLNFPNITIEKCTETESEVHLELRWLNQSIPCKFCGCQTDNINQRRPLKARDLSILGKFTVLTVERRQFRCDSCQKYFTEPIDFIDFDRHSTGRYQKYIYDHVKISNLTQVAREEHLTYDRVKSMFEQQYKKTVHSSAL
jgi:transposase